MALLFSLKDKKKDRILLVGDFERDRNGFRKQLINPNSSRVFKLKGSKNTLVAVYGSASELSILRVKLALPEGRDKVDYDYIVSEMVPQIFTTIGEYRERESKDRKNELESSVYIIQDNKMYEICCCGCVFEHDEIMSDGTSEGFILGSLYATQDEEDNMKRIKEALKVANEYDINNSYPFFVIDSSDLSYEIINKEVR